MQQSIEKNNNELPSLKWYEKFFLTKKERDSKDLKYLRSRLIYSTICFYILAILLVTLLVIFSISSMNLKNKYADSKMNYLENQLAKGYYKQENLEKTMQDTLGKAYVEGSEENFPNYVLTLVVRDLRKLEEEKWKNYTFFASSEYMAQSNNSHLEKAKNAIYEARNGYYYIKLGAFDIDYTYEAFKDHIEEMNSYSDLVIDLIDNPGGHVKALIDVLDSFYDKDAIILKQKTFNGKEENIHTYKAKRNKEIDFENIVILTNESTASCSEFMTLSLKENLDNVKIIGSKTFGKGIGTTTEIFKDGTGLQFINSYWYGPKDVPITNNGIMPDIIVEINKSEGNREDVVLNKAIEYLNIN